MATRPSSHRSSRSSPGRRRWPSRSSLVVGLVVVLLGTVPVLVPLLVTRASGESVLGAAPGVVGAGVPALPRPAAGGGPGPDATASSTSRAASPPAPSGSPAPSGLPSSRPPASTSAASPSAPAPTPGPAVTTTPAGGAPSTGGPPPTILATGPDLLVVSVSWSPGTPAAGDQVTFQAVVRNAGTDPTPAATHDVAFLVDGAEVSWSAGGTAPLAPGEQRTYTADGGPTASTWTAAPGTHSVTAWVDDADRIPETDDENNLLTATVEVV